MAAPIPSKLDHQQCIQGSYDEANGRLRVDAAISASIIAPPGLEVSILAIYDNIAIRNSNNNNELLINPDGSINVNTTLSGTSDINLQKVAGTNTSVGNGTSDAGTQRVAIASNNTPFNVNAVQSGAWTVSITPESIEIGTVDQGSPNTIGNAWPIKITDGVNTASVTAASALKVDGSAVTQPISGTITANIGTTGGLALDSTVAGLLTNTQLRATPVPISGSISFTAPQHVIVDSGTIIVTNSGTFAVQAAQSGTWTTGRTWTLSSGTDSIASVQSGTWNINNISGTISLPTGASTSANQTNGTQKTQLVDGSGNVIASTSNALNVDVTNTVPVSQSGSWTVTSNQGTSPWITKDQSDGPVSPGTVASFSQLMGGQFNTVLPTLTNTQQSAIQLDSSGRLIIAPLTSSSTVTANAGTGNFTVVQTTGSNLHVDVDNFPATVAVTQSTSPWVVSGTVTATLSYDENYGTVGANTLRVAAQIGNATGAADFNTGATSAQTLRVVANQGTSPWTVSGTVTANIGTTGGLALDSSLSTINTTLGTLLTNTQLRASPVPISGTVTVSNFPTTLDTNYGTVGASTLRTASQIGNATGAALFGAGTTTAQVLRVVLPTDQTAIPVTQSGSWTVIANAGTNLNTSALALDTTVSGLQVSQASTTAGQKGGLTLGAVTTNAPSYTTGQTDPISLDTSGLLRVSLKDTPSNTNKLLVTTDPITFASPQHVIVDSGSISVTQGTSPWVISGTVTANIGTTGGLALDSTLAKLTLAQGSTTSGETGPLMQGAVTTAAPSYTTGQTDPLSLTLAGALRVDGSGVTQPISGAISFTAPQHVILDSGTLTTITNPVTVNQGTSPWVISGAVTLPYDENYGTVGATTLRTAAEIGNATGAANFNYGAVGAQTLRVASQIGNATGAADFNGGTTGAQTLRTTSNLSDGAGTALTSTLFNSKQALDVRPSTGFSTAGNTRPAVTTASSTILAANTNRLYAYIQNNSGNNVFLKLGAAAVASQGISLPSGSIYEITSNNLWTGTIQAIKTSGASINLDVFEGTI